MTGSFASGRRTADAVSGGSGAGKAIVVRKSCADNVAQHGDSRVGVALAGQDELSERAAAQQDRAETDNQHAHEVPKMYGVRDRLAGETEVEVAGGQVADQSSNNNCNKSEQ